MPRIVGAWAGVVAAAVLASAPGQAMAHALVLESDPAQGAKLTEPPADRIELPLTPLAPGAYVVRYKVLAVDGHITEGVLRFSVLEPK